MTDLSGLRMPLRNAGFIGIAVLLGVFHAASSFTCPPVSNQALIPDPLDCRKYYHCLTDGRYFIKSCPNGLVFESKTKVCVWDSTSTSCIPDSERDNIVPPRAKILNKKRFNDPTPKPAPTTTTAAPATARTTQKVFVEKRDTSPTKKVVVDPTVKDDSEKGENVKEVPTMRTHSNGKVDSSKEDRFALRPSLLSANIDHSIRKRQAFEDNSIDTAPVKISCTSAFAYVTDPGNCDTFYHCNNYRPFLKRCPPGLFFDEENLVCNWPHNVNCIAGYRAKPYFAFNYMRRRMRPQYQNFVSKPKPQDPTTQRIPFLETIENDVKRLRKTDYESETKPTIQTFEAKDITMTDIDPSSEQTSEKQTTEEQTTKIQPEVKQTRDKQTTGTPAPETETTKKQTTTKQTTVQKKVETTEISKETSPETEEIAETTTSSDKSSSSQSLKNIWDAMTGSPDDQSSSTTSSDSGNDDQTTTPTFTAIENNDAVNETGTSTATSDTDTDTVSTTTFSFGTNLNEGTSPSGIQNDDPPIPHSFFAADRHAADQRSVFARDYHNVEDVEIEKFMLKMLNDAIQSKHIVARQASREVYQNDNLVDGTLSVKDDSDLKIKGEDGMIDEKTGDKWILFNKPKGKKEEFEEGNEDNIESSGDVDYHLPSDSDENKITGVIMKDEAKQVSETKENVITNETTVESSPSDKTQAETVKDDNTTNATVDDVTSVVPKHAITTSDVETKLSEETTKTPESTTKTLETKKPADLESEDIDITTSAQITTTKSAATEATTSSSPINAGNTVISDTAASINNTTIVISSDKTEQSGTTVKAVPLLKDISDIHPENNATTEEKIDVDEKNVSTETIQVTFTPKENVTSTKDIVEETTKYSVVKNETRLNVSSEVAAAREYAEDVEENRDQTMSSTPDKPLDVASVLMNSTESTNTTVTKINEDTNETLEQTKKVETELINDNTKITLAETNTTTTASATTTTVSRTSSTSTTTAKTQAIDTTIAVSQPQTGDEKGTKKSFISLSDLIKWYLRHWRHYSRWRESKEVTVAAQ